MKKKILAIIPARGGSKRIKNKNLTKINGFPLIYYTLKYAKSSGLCDMIFVSTDDKKISNKTEINSFSNLISVCAFKKEIGLKYELENNVNLINFKNNNIEISFNENLDKNFIKNLTTKLLDWTGERWIITLSKKTGLKTIKEIEVQNKNHKLDDLKKSELFKEAINLFPDLEIINVKDLEEDSND